MNYVKFYLSTISALFCCHCTNVPIGTYRKWLVVKQLSNVYYTALEFRRYDWANQYSQKQQDKCTLLESLYSKQILLIFWRTPQKQRLPPSGFRKCHQSSKVSRRDIVKGDKFHMLFTTCGLFFLHLFAIFCAFWFSFKCVFPSVENRSSWAFKDDLILSTKSSAVWSSPATQSTACGTQHKVPLQWGIRILQQLLGMEKCYKMRTTQNDESGTSLLSCPFHYLRCVLFLLEIETVWAS